MTSDLRRSPAIPNLATHVRHRLEEMLNAPEWRDGGRLPPETELAAQVGVSRPTLRKALAELREAAKADGLWALGHPVEIGGGASVPTNGFFTWERSPVSVFIGQLFCFNFFFVFFDFVFVAHKILTFLSLARNHHQIRREPRHRCDSLKNHREAPKIRNSWIFIVQRFFSVTIKMKNF